MSVNHSARSGGITGIISVFFTMKVYCLFSLVNSYENTQYTIFNLKKKSPLIILNLQPGDFFQGTQERVQNSRGK